MKSKLKNIIIIAVVIIALVVIYIVFIKKSPDVPNLSSTLNPSATVPTQSTPSATSATDSVANDFLVILLNVKSLTLNDAIFSDPAFTGLHDSSIELIPDGTEGRPNPFAPIGVDAVGAPSNTTTIVNPNSTIIMPTPSPSPATPTPASKKTKALPAAGAGTKLPANY